MPDKRIVRLVLVVLFSFLLSGCSVGPDYERPAMLIPDAFKEAGEWKIAEPKDERDRGKWWKVYQDSTLDALISEVEVSNQNIIAAKAQYRQAMAALDAARAGFFPNLTSNVSATRTQGTSVGTGTTGSIVSPGTPIRNIDRFQFGTSWELDLWGRIRRNVEAGEAQAEASRADLHMALLSAQATLTQSYVQLRVNEAQQRLLNKTIAAYQRSLEITRNRYTAGVAGRVDVVQAQTQLKSTQAQAIL